MIRMDYYSGEPSSGSPTFSDSTDTSEQFAVNARDLYNYNAMQRSQQQTQFNMNNGGWNPNCMNPPEPPNSYMFNGPGYTGPTNPYTIQVSQNGGPMQPLMQNNYMSPYQQAFQQRYGTPNQAPGYQGAPYMNRWQMQTQGLRTGNNPFQNSYMNYQQQPYYGQQVFYQPQYQDQVIHVPGYNPSGNIGMLRSDAEEVCDQMQVQMMLDQQKELAKREDRVIGYFNNNYNGYMNYYGTPYVNLSYDTNVVNLYKQKINGMIQEAIQRRTNFNKNLSRLCHNYLGDGYTEEDIDRIYDGYTYTIPGSKIQEDQHQDWLYSLVPYNNAYLYQNHYREVSQVYQTICPPGKDMNETFKNYGLLGFFDNLEEEFHRRRDGSRFYDGNVYDMYLRKYALEMEQEDLESGGMTRDKLYKKYQTPEQYISALQSGEISRVDFKRAIVEPELSKSGLSITDKGELHFELPTQWATQTTNGPPGPVLNNVEEEDFEQRKLAFRNAIIQNRHMGLNMA